MYLFSMDTKPFTSDILHFVDVLKVFATNDSLSLLPSLKLDIVEFQDRWGILLFQFYIAI